MLNNFSNDIKSISEDIDCLIEKHGFSKDILYATKNKQNLRYKVLTDIGVKKGSSVLDFGCGLGDFYLYCKNKFKNIKYIGVDINDCLIQECKRRYPNMDARYVNIAEQSIDENVDFVINSGAFNYPFISKRNYEFIEFALKELFKITKIGIASDFFSSYVDYRNEKLFYSDPVIIFNIAKSISKRVVIRYDYFPFEFCVYIFKNDSVNTRYVFDGFEKGLTKREKEIGEKL